MTDETSTRRQGASEDPPGAAGSRTRAVAYPSDPPGISEALSSGAGPTVTVLTDAEAAELTRLHTTRSIECGAMTTHLMCRGCDGAAMDGGGMCLHDCHDEVEDHAAALTAMQDYAAHERAEIAEAAYARGVAVGRREAFEYELAQSEGCAAALDRLPGQQQAAALYRLHAEHVRAVLAQEGAGR